MIEGSRPDVIMDGDNNPMISTNSFKTIGRRSSTSDAKAVNKSINYKILPNYDPFNIH